MVAGRVLRPVPLRGCLPCGRPGRLHSVLGEVRHLGRHSRSRRARRERATYTNLLAFTRTPATRTRCSASCGSSRPDFRAPVARRVVGLRSQFRVEALVWPLSEGIRTRHCHLRHRVSPTEPGDRCESASLLFHTGEATMCERSRVLTHAAGFCGLPTLPAGRRRPQHGQTDTMSGRLSEFGR